MTQAGPIARGEEMLGEYAEMEHALGKEAFKRAMASQDTDQFNSLSRTFKMLGRSLRQSLALRERLARFRAQDARANPPPGPPRDEVRIARRREALRAAVRRVIFTEAETERRDYLWSLLDDNLDNKRQPDDWGLEPLADQVMAFCAAYRLSLEQAERFADLPDPPPEFEPDWDDEDDDDEDQVDYAQALRRRSG